MMPLRKTVAGIVTVMLTLYSVTALRVSAQRHYLDSLLQWVKKNPKIDSQYIQTLHRITWRMSENDIKGAFHYYELVSALSDSLHFGFGKSLAQINLGILLYNAGSFEASNNAYFRAIDEAESCGSLRLKAVSLNNIGENFKILKDYPRSRRYTREALAMNTALRAWRGVAINYELLFDCDFSEKKYDSAKTALLEGMPYAMGTGESYILAQYYLDFGKLHRIGAHPDSSAYYFDRAIHEAEHDGDLKNRILVYLARAQYIKGLPPAEKIVLLDSALRIAQRTGYLELVSNAAHELSAEYEQLSNKDSAMQYYRVYRSAAEALFSENNRRNVIIRESEWMLRRKEMENQNLKQLAQYQHNEITIKNRLLLSVIISLLITTALGVLLYRSIQSGKKRKESMFRQRIAETEMQMLRAQMNPHFIFNCLSSINNFILKNQTEIASDYLTRFSRLIRTVLNNSRKTLIPLEDELEMLRLYLAMEMLRFKSSFHYFIHLDASVNAVSVFIPPLLLQPFVENAVWHGLMHKKEQGRLDIFLSLEHDVLNCIIKDNGVGRSAAAAWRSKSAEKEKSMGVQITKERLAFFNGEIDEKDFFDIEDIYDENGAAAGTRVWLKIKCKNAAGQW